MFRDMRGLVQHAIDRRFREQGLNDGFVHCRNAERRAKSFAGIEGNSLQARAGVIGSQDDHDIVRVMTGLSETVSADLAGEDISGMGHNDGHRFFDPGRQGVLQILFDGQTQFVCGCRIELAGKSRFPDAVSGVFVGLTGRRQKKNNHRQKTKQTQPFHMVGSPFRSKRRQFYSCRMYTARCGDSSR